MITVVIPAYNAADTIDETLRSVRAQTWSDLEIIVVDDGSTDRTAQVADAHAAVDPRLRVVRQANAGVAAARNTGWRAGRGDIFAFVDADDLWSADKTERQLAALRAAPGAGLVYSWSVVIDAASRITLQWPGAEWQGEVLDKLLVDNFVGNGSAVMVTRAALEDAGGFDPEMRAADAGGCEDILFYARVAERHRFALAPGYLVGYRYVAGNMSSDLARMMRSWLLMQDEIVARHPELAATSAAGIERFARWLVRRSIELSQPRHLAPLLRLIARRSPGRALAIFATEVPKALRDFGWRSLSGRAWSTPPGERFAIGTPAVPASDSQQGPEAR